MNLFFKNQLLTKKGRQAPSSFSLSPAPTIIFLFLLGVASIFSPSTLSAAEIVAKIDKKEISLKEFQSFVNVQVFMNSYKNLEELIAKQKSSRSKLLQSFIDHTLLLDAAKKEKIDMNTPSVKKAFADVKENWIVSLFLSRKIDIMALSQAIDEEKIRKEYAQLPQSKSKPFDQLDDREKQQVGQLVFAKLSQVKKDQLRQQLSKKYKAKKKGVDKKVVFVIGRKEYSQEDFKKYFKKQLRRIGISAALLKSRQPEKYKEISENQLDDMMLYELVALEIANKRFEKKNQVRNGMNLLVEQLIIQDFLQKKIVSNIKVNEEELNQAFTQISKRDPSINNMMPLEQERVTKDFVRKNKMPEAIEEFLIEIKERSLIRRFKNVLQKVK